MVFMISSMVAPFFRWSISITWPVLLPPRTPAGFGAGAAFLPLGAALAGVAFLTRLALHRRALRGLCATRGLLSGFRLRGRRLGLCGLGLGLRGLAQVLGAVPNLAGCRLAGLEAFHRGNARQAVEGGYQASAGQPAISSARSFSLAKESKGVVVAAAASSGPANTLMLFSLSMVNVFILNLLLFRAYAVMDMDHSVPPRRQGNCSRKSNDGEGLAMHRAQVAENGRKWQESEAKAERSDPCAPDDHERGTGCSRRQNRTQDAVSMAAGAGVRQGLSEGTSLRIRAGPGAFAACVQCGGLL